MVVVAKIAKVYGAFSFKPCKIRILWKQFVLLPCPLLAFEACVIAFIFHGALLHFSASKLGNVSHQPTSYYMPVLQVEGSLWIFS